MQSIGQSLRANPLIGLMLLMGVMLATRFHNVSSVTHLPDASLAIFFLTGFYFRRASYLIPLMALAGGIDYVATQHMGVSDFCLSPANPFLIPTYAAMWYGGRWYGARHSLTLASLAPLAAALFISGSVAFIISNFSFYLFSDRYADTGLAEYTAHLRDYYLPYMGSGIALYVAFAAIAHTGVMKAAAR